MRVAVLGGGYAGLVLARTLEGDLPDDAELHVVDETGEHLIQHELHRAIRRPGLADELRIPLDGVLETADLHEARVTGIDTDERRVELADGHLRYDVAAVCLGAQTAYYGLPGVERHATPLKRPRHAATIRGDFLDVAARGGRVVVGGAGLSGVQVAGELAAFARDESADVEVVLLEQRDDVAPSFPERFRTAVRRELGTRGVDVQTGTAVTEATADAVRLEEGGAVEYDQLVWTGGIRGPDALAGERPTVRSTLALDDRTFVVGDAGRVVDAEGEAVPASAQAATRAARTAARNIRRLVEGDDDGFTPRLEQFTFDASGWLVSVGDGAVAQVGPTVLTGAAAKALKSSVGAGYLASAGAVRDAVRLVREEFRHGGTTDDRPAAERQR